MTAISESRPKDLVPYIETLEEASRDPNTLEELLDFCVVVPYLGQETTKPRVVQLLKIFQSPVLSFAEKLRRILDDLDPPDDDLT